MIKAFLIVLVIAVVLIEWQLFAFINATQGRLVFIEGRISELERAVNQSPTGWPLRGKK